jgi:C1q-related factor
MSTLRVNEIQHSSGTAALTIDSSGRVLRSNIPAFDAVLTTTTGSLQYTTANTEIVFNSVNINEGLHYNTTTGRFTAPIAGKYMFCVFGMASQTVAWYDIRVNGAVRTFKHSTYSSQSTVGEWAQSCENTIISLSQGDYVSVFTGATTGGIYGGGNNHNGFCGYLIG